MSDFDEEGWEENPDVMMTAASGEGLLVKFG